MRDVAKTRVMSRWDGGPGGRRGDGHTPKPSGSDGVSLLWGEGSGGWYLGDSCASQKQCTAHPPFHPHPLTQVLEGLGAASLPRAADLLFDLMGKR